MDFQSDSKSIDSNSPAALTNFWASGEANFAVCAGGASGEGRFSKGSVLGAMPVDWVTGSPVRPEERLQH